jgi:sulfide:quinone oxidoreductase
VWSECGLVDPGATHAVSPGREVGAWIQASLATGVTASCGVASPHVDSHHFSVVSSVPEQPERAAPFRVVIAGGGVAAIEAALALRATPRPRITLAIATSSDDFIYRPFAVVRPFQARPTYRIELAQVAADLDAELVAADAVAVDGDRRQLVLSNGQTVSYDALLIAIGARAEAIVGGGTLTPWDWGEGHAFRSILGALGRGEARSVAFIVPAALTWPLPLYELALLTSAHLRDKGISDVTLSVVTCEPGPLADLGAEASASVAALLEQRGITVFTNSVLAAIEDGTVRTSRGASVAAEVTVAVPVIQARTLRGVPTDPAGFIPVDDYCRVEGQRDVFAAGDCTVGHVKQGGLAAQQADVAAGGIAALAGAETAPEPFQPELHAVLLTGDAPLQIDPTGVRPLPSVDATIDPQLAEKIVARHLTSYLAHATPPLKTPG